MAKEVDQLQAEVAKLQTIIDGYRQRDEEFFRNQLAVAHQNVENLKQECNRLSNVAQEIRQLYFEETSRLKAQLEAAQRLQNYGSTREPILQTQATKRTT